MSNRRTEFLLADILEAIEKILLYTQGMAMEDFVANQMVIDAVVRNFEIIGEAANHIPQEIKSKYPDIDWNKMRGFRNRIVHDYFDVDVQIVWNIKTNYLEHLYNEVRNLKLED